MCLSVHMLFANVQQCAYFTGICIVVFIHGVIGVCIEMLSRNFRCIEVC